MLSRFYITLELEKYTAELLDQYKSKKNFLYRLNRFTRLKLKKIIRFFKFRQCWFVCC